MKRPLILVTNDDGITSNGIRQLVQICQKIGEVVVVAPDSPQSGMGHAITIGESLRLDLVKDIFGESLAYTCSGTPADCVKLAKHLVLKDRKPDLVVSGINHGSNTSISVLYSGTMSAAIEAAIEGIPAIGFSLCDYTAQADFSHILKFVDEIIKQALQFGIPKATALNVNFPNKTMGEVKGIKVCRQARAKWSEDFDERKDPHGRSYFWMTGEFINEDKGEDTDEYLISQGFATIVPCAFDLTAHYGIAQLNKDWNLQKVFNTH
ncbi:MAG: 5'/3'-nucleotidase SurE [Opitutaceae bacterium]|nr:5'/3'-nucleotidase SurE [Cytophagales bacterium]